MQTSHKFHALAFVVITCASIAGTAQAEDTKLGVYSGTVAISGAELGKDVQTHFSADVKISIPLTSASSSSAMAEVSDVDKPSATALIKQWSVNAKNGSADSDGKITSWTCEIAAPTEIPMNASGTLNIDYTAHKHSLFIALVSLKSIPLKCVNSRSGPYKDEVAVGLFFGTSEPDVLPWVELPFENASNLKATYQLVPVSAMKGQYGPVDMAWDLRLE